MAGMSSTGSLPLYTTNILVRPSTITGAEPPSRVCRAFRIARLRCPSSSSSAFDLLEDRLEPDLLQKPEPAFIPYLVQKVLRIDPHAGMQAA